MDVSTGVEANVQWVLRFESRSARTLHRGSRTLRQCAPRLTRALIRPNRKDSLSPPLNQASHSQSVRSKSLDFLQPQIITTHEQQMRGYWNLACLNRGALGASEVLELQGRRGAMSIVSKLIIGGSMTTFVMVGVWALQIFQQLTAASDCPTASDGSAENLGSRRNRCVCGRVICPLGPDAFVNPEPVAGFMKGTVARKSEPALLIPKFDIGHLGH